MAQLGATCLLADCRVDPLSYNIWRRGWAYRKCETAVSYGKIGPFKTEEEE